MSRIFSRNIQIEYLCIDHASNEIIIVRNILDVEIVVTYVPAADLEHI